MTTRGEEGGESATWLQATASRSGGARRCKGGEQGVGKDAIFVKAKQDGMVPRRIIGDLRRSGAYSKSVCPERIIVPEIPAACQVLRQRWRTIRRRGNRRPWGKRLDTRACEVESAGFSVAYMQWRVDPRVRHLLHGALRGIFAVPVAVSLLRFGAAPLLGGRLSVAGARSLCSWWEPGISLACWC